MISFIKEFRDIGTEYSHAPPIFWEFTGLITLATLVQDKVYIRFGLQKLRPNLYCILLGPSRSGKSTVLSLCNKILRAIDEDIVTGYSSTERFLNILREREEKSMLLSVDEIRTYLDWCNTSYGVGFHNLIMELYEGLHSIKRQYQKGDIIVPNPPVTSFLGAGVLSWFLNYISEGDIQAGFWGRFLAIIGILPPEGRRPIPPQEIPNINGLIKKGHEFYNMEYKDLVIGEEAIEVYSQWYKEEWEKELNIKSYDKADLILQTFRGTLDVCVLKLAMLFALDYDLNTKEIRAPFIERAINYIYEVRKGWDKLILVERLGERGIHQLLNKVRAYLMYCKVQGIKEVPVRDIYRRFHVTSRTMRQHVLPTLLGSEEIDLLPREGKKPERMVWKRPISGKYKLLFTEKKPAESIKEVAQSIKKIGLKEEGVL